MGYRHTKLFTALTVFVYLGLANSGCGGAGSSASTQNPTNSDSSFQASTPVQLVGTGTKVQVSATGGTPPYSFSVLSGGGSVDSAGLFTAPAAEGSVVIEAADSKNGKQDVTLTVGPALASGVATLALGEGLSSTLFPTGGSPPYSYHVTGPGQIIHGANALGENFVTYTAAQMAGADTMSISDAQGTELDIPVTIPALPSNIYLWTTVAGDGVANRFAFDPNDNSFSSLESVTTPVETVLRGGTVAPDGSFYLGSALDLAIQKINANFTLGPVVTISPGSGSLTGVHALCTLPNGHFIAADENDPSTGYIAEFATDGSLVSELGTVGAPYVPANHPGVTNCQALSNKKVIFVADDTWGGTGGEAVEMNFTSGAWNVAQRVDFAELDSQLGTMNTSPWAMAAHTDGSLYIAPGLASGTATHKLIRCPLDHLTAASCSEVGTQDLPFGPSWIYGLSQIPGSNDLLVSSSTAIYRYDYTSGVYTSLCDVTASVGSCFLDASAYIRGFVMR